MFEDESDENTSIQVKNLSDGSKYLLRELETISFKATELIPKLYSSLRQDGFEPFEARQMIESHIQFNQRTLRRALPDEAKNQSQVRKQLADKMSAKVSNATLVLDKDPEIPAPPQPIIEHIPEPEPVPTVILKPPPKHQKIKIEIPFGYLVRLSNEANRLRTKAIYSLEYDMDIKQVTDVFIDKK